MATRKSEQLELPIESPETEQPETTPEQPKFYQVTAREYMVTFPPFTLMLYPGTSAVVTQEQLDQLHPINRAMLDVVEITEQQFIDLFAKQGKIGWV